MPVVTIETRGRRAHLGAATPAAASAARRDAREHDPGREHALSRPNVAAPRADVRACRRRVRDDERLALLR